MKSVPQSIRNLTSLTFLDLRSNQLVSLPREICFLPIQILLVSNNKLIQLPEELGKMSELTELDAGVNQLSHLPSRLCDLTKLRSLCLRNNQINFLPKEISSMNLVSLDLSCNKISSLPLEIRYMTELIDLNLTDNPLTSPPAQLCSKGTVFIFKYLENLASKNEGSNSLRRSIGKKPPTTTTSTHQIYDIKTKKNISPDSVDITFDPLAKLDIVPHSFHIRTELSKSDTSTPTQGFPSALNDALLDNDLLKRKLESRTIIKSDPTSMNNISMLPDSIYARPEAHHKTPEKLKSVAENIQTYREYKEALKQQRSNDIYSIYKCRDTIERSNSDSSNLNGNKEISPDNNGADERDGASPQSNNEKNLHSNGNGVHEDNTYMKPNSPLKLIKTNGQHRAANNNVNMNGTKGQIRNKITSNAR